MHLGREIRIIQVEPETLQPQDQPVEQPVAKRGARPEPAVQYTPHWLRRAEAYRSRAAD